MMVTHSLLNRLRFPFSPWPSLLVGFLVIKAVLSLGLGLGEKLAPYGSGAYFLLLLLATGFAALNAVERTQGRRMFWAFIAGGYALWSLDQWLYIYYVTIRHIDVPDNSIADPALFLHLVPLMAAIAMQPHLRQYDQKSYRATLNFLFLLVFWVFLYAYFLFPYQYLFPNSEIYNPRFTMLYALENAALVLILCIVARLAQAPWRSVYYHLLGASTLYGLSSTLANVAIDAGKPYNGSLCSLAQNAAVCWFLWVPLDARQRYWQRT
ncbi:MAG TPA: hypothetical protein VGH37_01495 [Candidatus Acidoferrum sp.]|jgi:hypothetical protein